MGVLNKDHLTVYLLLGWWRKMAKGNEVFKLLCSTPDSGTLLISENCETMLQNHNNELNHKYKDFSQLTFTSAKGSALWPWRTLRLKS